MVSIDGTDISGATIDGTEVQEITVDGDTVWTSLTSTDRKYLYNNGSYESEFTINDSEAPFTANNAKNSDNLFLEMESDTTFSETVRVISWDWTDGKDIWEVTDPYLKVQWRPDSSDSKYESEIYIEDGSGNSYNFVRTGGGSKRTDFVVNLINNNINNISKFRFIVRDADNTTNTTSGGTYCWEIFQDGL